MIAARHHITLRGRHITPGEVIDEPVAPETLRWWLSAGAVEEIGGEDDAPPWAEPAESGGAPEEIAVSAGVVAPDKPKTRRSGRKKT